jgi:hypothetical protein
MTVAVDLNALRVELLSHGWTDHAVEDDDGTFIYMIHRPDNGINWHTVFVADNGYVSLGHESLSLDGKTVEQDGGWRLTPGDPYWAVLDLIKAFIDAYV